MKLYNKATNEYGESCNEKLTKFVCKDCGSTYFGYNNCLCTECDSVQSGDITDTLYIFADCFSHANGKAGMFAGYTTIVTNDRFDLEDKFNIEYINRAAFEGTTNNYGELMGVLDGLVYFVNEEVHSVYKKVVVVSDSEYVILGARERMAKWRAKGWRNTSGDVKNKEIWIMMYQAVQEISKMNVILEFKHQRGHIGSPTKDEDPMIYFQDKCDALSVGLKAQILNKRKED